VKLGLFGSAARGDGRARPAPAGQLLGPRVASAGPFPELQQRLTELRALFEGVASRYTAATDAGRAAALHTPRPPSHAASHPRPPSGAPHQPLAKLTCPAGSSRQPLMATPRQKPAGSLLPPLTARAGTPAALQAAPACRSAAPSPAPSSGGDRRGRGSCSLPPDVAGGVAWPPANSGRSSSACSDGHRRDVAAAAAAACEGYDSARWGAETQRPCGAALGPAGCLPPHAGPSGSQRLRSEEAERQAGKRYASCDRHALDDVPTLAELRQQLQEERSAYLSRCTGLVGAA